MLHTEAQSAGHTAHATPHNHKFTTRGGAGPEAERRARGQPPNWRREWSGREVGKCEVGIHTEVVARPASGALHRLRLIVVYSQNLVPGINKSAL